jgi:hypothetical protein
MSHDMTSPVPEVPVPKQHELLLRGEYEEAGGKGQYDRGVLTSTLGGWSEFYDEVSRFRDCGGYVWRGQEQHGDGWTLRSKFDRQNKGGDRKKRLEQHKQEFAKAIRGRRGPNPPELSEDDLWALGQHHNLATPLLDWTESPFVAAYFAFRRKEANTSERVVYALNRDIERWHPSNKPARFIEFPPINSHENVRFLAQGGVFTKALEGEDVKTRIQKCYHERNHADRIILVEILIPDNSRDECLKDLNWMNINHASLFPDIYGAALFCNWKLEISGMGRGQARDGTGSGPELRVKRNLGTP